MLLHFAFVLGHKRMAQHKSEKVKGPRARRVGGLGRCRGGARYERIFSGGLTRQRLNSEHLAVSTARNHLPSSGLEANRLSSLA
jgi:hypothetical protein